MMTTCRLQWSFRWGLMAVALASCSAHAAWFVATPQDGCKPISQMFGGIAGHRQSETPEQAASFLQHLGFESTVEYVSARRALLHLNDPRSKDRGNHALFSSESDCRSFLKWDAMRKSPSIESTASQTAFLDRDNTIPVKPMFPVKRTKDFKPFLITSSKLKKTVSSGEFEAKLMCRPMIENLEGGISLVKDFDIVSTSGDHSLGAVTFRGEQGGKAVDVTLMTTKSDGILKHIWVDGTPMLGCDVSSR